MSEETVEYRVPADDPCRRIGCKQPAVHGRLGQFCSERCKSWVYDHRDDDRKREHFCLRRKYENRPIAVRFQAWLGTKYGQLVLDEILRRVHDLKRRGVRRAGIKGLFEAVRWDPETWERLGASPDAWKMNNSYAAPMARLLMTTYPGLEGMFEVRERRPLDSKVAEE